MTFVAFVAEQAVISILDILICGIGAFLLFRGQRARAGGIVLLVLYALAGIGAVMGDGLTIQHAFGLGAALVGGLVGWRSVQP